MFSLKLISSKKSLEEQRGIFFKRNIKSSYSVTDEGTRVIFFPKKRGQNNLNDPVVRECNGLIFKTSNKPELLVVPPCLLSHRINYNTVNKHMENYNIYKIQDGTTINMYWWETKTNPSWRISTAKAYDATDLTWNSDTTYKNIFDSILLNTFSMTPDKFYSSLDKKRCYSWGFNHPKYHPFWEGKTKPANEGTIWFIQSVKTSLNKVSVANLNNSEMKNCGTEVSFESPFENINSQEKLDISEVNINDIRSECDNALNRYENTYIRANNNSDQSPEVLFGYILRSKNPKVTKGFSNLIIESSLLRKIRKLYYNKHFRETSTYNGYDRENYIVLYNFVNGSTHNIFQLLFPQYKKEFLRLENKVEELSDEVIRLYQNQNTTFKSNGIKLNDEEIKTKKSKTTLENVAYVVMSYVDTECIVDVENPAHEEYIKQVIKSSDMIDKLYLLCY